MKIRIRRILIPVLFCLTVACLIEVPLSMTDLFGDEVILWDTLFRAIVAVPILVHFYREDEVFRQKERWGAGTALWVGGLGAASSLLLSAAIKALGIPGYDAAEETLFAGRLWLELLVLLAASPLLEEFFFRGVLYQRFKELMNPVCSALVTAALFGLFHGNPGQGLYAFLMGLLLAFVMEKTQTVKAPILFHFAANGAAVVLSMIL